MKPEVEQTVRDLVRLLDEMRELYGQLRTTIRKKLQAMREASIELLQSCTAREGFLAGRIAEREGLRRQLVERLAGRLGLAPAAARSMPVSQVAQHLSEPLRGRLLAVAAGLREQAEAVQTANRTAALATGSMLKHLRAVTDAMTEGGTESTVYSAAGRPEVHQAVRVFEAVG